MIHVALCRCRLRRIRNLAFFSHQRSFEIGKFCVRLRNLIKLFLLEHTVLWDVSSCGLEIFKNSLLFLGIFLVESFTLMSYEFDCFKFIQK